MLPATAAVPKELLPIGGRPAIDWILDEAAIAGIERVVVVSNPAKPAIERYLAEGRRVHRRYPVAEQLGLLDSEPMRPLEVEIVHQREPRGLGDAVRVGRHAVGDEPLAVLLPDELLFGGAVLLAAMLERHAEEACSVVSLMQVGPEEISSYGCAKLASSATGGLLAVTGCVEKPEADCAPSNYAICGRYVLDTDVLDELESTEADARGEVQLTAAIDAVARRREVIGIELLMQDGRIDIGNWTGWLAANRRAFDPGDPLGPGAGSGRRTDAVASTPSVA